MGISSSSVENDPSFLQQYQLVREKQEDEIGQGFIYQSRNTKQLVLYFESIYQNEQRYNDEIDRLQEIKTNNQPNFLNLLNFNNQIEENVCAKHYRVNFMVEYSEDTLQKFLRSSITSGVPKIPEDDLWFFNESMINAMVFMQRQGKSHGDLRLKTIYMKSDSNSTIYQVLQPELSQKPKFIDILLCTNSGQDALAIAGRSQEDYQFMAPEVLKLISQNSKSNASSSNYKNQQYSSSSTSIGRPEINMTKADVFSLGMVSLCLATMSTCEELIDSRYYSIKEHILAQKLQAVRNQYTPRYCKFLQNMLTIDPQSRTDFVELAEFLLEEGRATQRMTYKPSLNFHEVDHTTNNDCNNVSFLSMSGVGGGLFNKANSSYYRDETPIRNYRDRDNLPVGKFNPDNKENFNFAEEEYGLSSNTTSSSSVVNQVSHYNNGQKDSLGSNNNYKLPQNFANNRGSLFLIKEDKAEDENSLLRTDGFQMSKLSNDGSSQKLPLNSSGLDVTSPNKNFNQNNAAFMSSGALKENQTNHFKKNSFNIYDDNSAQKLASSPKHELLSTTNQIFSQPPQSQNNQPSKRLFDDKPSSNTKEDIGKNQTEKAPNRGMVFVNESYDDGSSYEGYQVDGMRHGEGQHSYPTGAYYTGEWVRNSMHGKGKLYYGRNSLAYDGLWQNDLKHGQGVLFNKSVNYGDTRAVDYQNFNPSLQNFVKYQGEFFNQKRQGHGRIYFINGEYYDGQFSNDNIDGQGVYTAQKGIPVEGQWQNGVLISKQK